LALHHHRVLACTHQIAHRFVGHVGYIDGRQLARPRQARQLRTVAPIGLDPITHPPRCVRRCHHPTHVTALHQAAIDSEAARPRFVDKHQLVPGRLELAHRSPQRIRIAADLTVMPNLPALLGNGYIDRLLVHVKTNVQLARLLTHGLPPVFRLTLSRSTLWLYVARHAIHDIEEAGRLLNRKPFCLTVRPVIARKAAPVNDLGQNGR